MIDNIENKIENLQLQECCLKRGFIKTTDHGPTDHRPTDPPTTYQLPTDHLPTEPPTNYY